MPSTHQLIFLRLLMKKLFTVILLFSIALSINLNSLNDSDINELSKYISKDKSLLIKRYIANNGHINNIYELNSI